MLGPENQENPLETGLVRDRSNFPTRRFVVGSAQRSRVGWFMSTWWDYHKSHFFVLLDVAFPLGKIKNQLSRLVFSVTQFLPFSALSSADQSFRLDTLVLIFICNKKF